jgi:signal peptidase I
MPQFVQGLLRAIRELVLSTAIALAATLVFNVFVAQAVTIDQGPSMQPNLHVGDRVLMEKISYRYRLPERGEVVVVARPDDQPGLIKRVIALPGQMVEVRDGHVWVDGFTLIEPWVTYWGGPSYPPTRVPYDCLFILGDNRPGSLDSRMLGPVRLDAVEGRAILVYWPPERIGLIH